MLALFSISQAAFSQSNLSHGVSKFSDDTVLVSFVPGAAAAEVAQAHRDVQGSVVRSFDAIGIKVIRVPKGSATRAVDSYLRNPNVEFADLNYVRTIFYPATNEGSEPGLGVANNFNEQYGLHNTGQQFGASLDPIFGTLVYPTFQATAGADIKAQAAWDITQGSSSVVIAVLDSGIACDHLDLTNKCIEEVNFVEEHGSTLQDAFGHGTHVAGIAAASTDNNTGIAGVGWNTRVGSLKTCYEDYTYAFFGVVIGQCEDDDVIEAIMHATDSGKYQVISMSFAGEVISSSVETAVDHAWNNGLVLVAGAGNNYSDDIMYPAAFANVIGVGSTDYHDNLSSFSTFGPWVSVLAPGSNILSTVPGDFCGQPLGDPSDCYDYKSGTSMSTPHVSGLAALLWAQNPGASNAEIRSLIENGADSTGVMGQNFLAWSEHGRINMASSLSGSGGDGGGGGGGGGGAEPTSHHVQSITLTTQNAGRGAKHGQATITIVDDLGGPVSGVTVSGTFSGAFNESFGSTTDGNGSVTFTTAATAKGGVTFGFCVTGVSDDTTTIYLASDKIASCANF
jgi:thermitase